MAGDHDDQDSSGNIVPKPEISATVTRVPLPSLWTTQAEGWIFQIEAMFNLASVKSQRTKHDNILTILNPDQVTRLHDVLKVTCLRECDDPYTKLITAIKDRYTMSEDRRVESLLAGVDIGDRTPSDFYRFLQTLAGDNTAVTIKMVERIWLRQLPEQVQLCVTTTSSTDMESILKTADKAFELIRGRSRSQVNAVASTSKASKSEPNSDILDRLTSLEKMLKDLKFDRSSRSTSRGRNDKNGRSPAKPNKDDLCWFHKKHGDDARKCREPCKRHAEFTKKQENK